MSLGLLINVLLKNLIYSMSVAVRAFHNRIVVAFAMTKSKQQEEETVNDS